MDWNYLNFKPSEFTCKHCKAEGIAEELMVKLQSLREEANFPFIITSGYRCEDHPAERKKETKGIHCHGLAVDILCSHQKAFKLIELAYKHGFTGIGVKQTGSDRFIHLDISNGSHGKPRPHIWSY